MQSTVVLVICGCFISDDINLLSSLSPSVVQRSPFGVTGFLSVMFSVSLAAATSVILSFLILYFPGLADELMIDSF